MTSHFIDELLRTPVSVARIPKCTNAFTMQPGHIHAPNGRLVQYRPDSADPERPSFHAIPVVCRRRQCEAQPNLGEDSTMEPTFLPATQLATLVRDRKLGALELLDHYIGRTDRLDPRINAVVVRHFDRARARAKSLDSKSDKSAPLFGVPTTVKESFDVAG